MQEFFNKARYEVVSVTSQGFEVVKKSFALVLCGREGGFASITAVLGAVLVLFIGILFVVNLTPEIETQITSANITNTMTKSLVDMSEWVLPVGAIGALIFGAVMLLKGGKSKA